MKTLKLLLLPLLFVNFLHAKTESITIPKEIETKLCQKLLDKACNSKETLESDHYLELDNNRTLFFFHIRKEEGPYNHGYSNLPVIVNTKGTWTVVDKFIDAEIQELVRDSHGGIWLRALWMIEGVSPSLYYSRDALHWEHIIFPQNRPSQSPFEDMRLCLLEKSVELTFISLDDEEKDKTWSSSYQNAIEKKAQWKALNYKKNCQNPYLENNDTWQIQKNNGNLIMVFKPMEVPPSVPTPTNTLLYTIQLGAFNHKESRTAMTKEIREIKEKLISKEYAKEGKPLYKLYLGSFKSREEATKKLNELRIQFKEHKHLKNAFIQKL